MESFGKGGKISSLRKALYKVKGQTRVKGVKRRQKIIIIIIMKEKSEAECCCLMSCPKDKKGKNPRKS